MSELRVIPEVVQSLITHFEVNDHLIVVWAQTNHQWVRRFESLMDFNCKQMFKLFHNSGRELIRSPQIDKYYVYCDRNADNFYRVFVINSDPETNESMVEFIDFGYTEVVSNDCLLIYDQLFFDCKPLAQKFVLKDIRPKHLLKGWDSPKLVNCLQKFLHSIQAFVIFDEIRVKSVKVFNSDREEVLINALKNECSDDIYVVERELEYNHSVMAIEYNRRQPSNAIQMPSNDSMNKESVDSFSFAAESPLNSFNKTMSSLTINEDSVKIEEKTIELMNCKQSQVNCVNGTDFVAKMTSNLIDFEGIDENPEQTEEQLSKIIDQTDSKSFKTFLDSFIGEKHSVYITKSFAEKTFYCQLMASYDSIEELSKELNEFYGENEENTRYQLNDEDLVISVVIAAKYTIDKKWYRASISAIGSKRKKVKVFYIDFGNFETMEVKNCRHLKKEFLVFPAQAIHCRPLNKDLSSDTLEMYETNCLEIECEFLEKAINDDTLDVLLYENGNPLKDSVTSFEGETTELMASSPTKLDSETIFKPKTIESEPIPVSVSKDKPNTKSEVKAISEPKSRPKTPSEANPISKSKYETNTAPKTEAKSAPTTTSKAKPAYDPKTNNNTEFDETDDNLNDEIVESDEMKAKTIRLMKELVGFNTKIMLTFIESGTSIYCQLPDSSLTTKNLIIDMSDYYSNCNDQQLKPNEQIDTNKFYSVFNSFTDEFLRAKIFAVTADDRLKVFFIDFGKTATVDLDDCHQLLEIYSDLIPQAIHCRPLNTDLSYQTLIKMEANERPIDVTFGDFDGKNEIGVMFNEM